MANEDSHDRIITDKSSAGIAQKTHAEYIALHKKVDTRCGNTADADFEKILFSSKTSNKQKKEVLLVLAHRRTPEAYAILKRYAKRPDGGLAAWAELARNECRN